MVSWIPNRLSTSSGAPGKVYLPVLHPFSRGNLLFLHYHPHSELVVNRLKITEPKLDVRDVLPLSELDVLITPLVAFDEQGQRLGMGGVLRQDAAKLAAVRIAAGGVCA